MHSQPIPAGGNAGDDKIITPAEHTSKNQAAAPTEYNNRPVTVINRKSNSWSSYFLGSEYGEHQYGSGTFLFKSGYDELANQTFNNIHELAHAVVNRAPTEIHDVDFIRGYHKKIDADPSGKEAERLLNKYHIKFRYSSS